MIKWKSTTHQLSRSTFRRCWHKRTSLLPHTAHPILLVLIEVSLYGTLLMDNSAFLDIPECAYSYDSSQEDTLRNLAQRVLELRRLGNLTPEALKHIRQYFRIKNIYNSNAIEGNQLDIGETRQVVEQGLTIAGKPLKDQAEAKNLSAALDFLEQLASNRYQPISEHDIRQIHALVLKGIDDRSAGAYRNSQVTISGSKYTPPGPESVGPKMREFGIWLETASVAATQSESLTSALVNAAVAHTWFVTIHPFVDGNGRVARLLMNLILMRSGYPIAIITREDRLRYYDALEESQTSNLSPFIGLVAECIQESLEEYEEATHEQRQNVEWAQSLAQKFTAAARTRAQNEYEVWRTAMELLKSYFRQTAEILNQSANLGRVFFIDFGQLDWERYETLRGGESAKRTWYFRLDFRSGEKAARYLFFFGFRSLVLKSKADVTLFIAREEPINSYHYERLDFLNAPDVPQIAELGYDMKGEQFIARTRQGAVQVDKIERIGQQFMEEVIDVHFSS